ncbi:MAG: YdiU family protein [bacterium]|nr:YdiU family protein [bacterium]
MSSRSFLETPDMGWRFEHTYANLPESLFAKAQPLDFPNPQLAVLNVPLAQELGLAVDQLSSHDAAQLFSGQQLPPDAEPIAQAYAGHQFGGFTMLGDGRALLIGEHRTPQGRLVDIQFKGSGQTPFSRRGDGLAALGPMLREYIISEAMHALGIPTTRSLAVVTTGQPVYRESVLQGAVLTRVASSHIRVGTFQYLAARQDIESLKALADYTICRHFPDLRESSDPYLQLLQAVIQRQAELVAKWQMVGFIHGVMNTDNMALAGETIDYGPCAFMDSYHPQTVFSSIDQGGRYAYGNQPPIAHWNLARFAETLLPLLATDQETAIEMATAAIGKYAELFEDAWLNGMRAKLGLQTQQAGDRALVEDLLAWMQSSQADFTNTFDDLSSTSRPDADVYAAPDFQNWHAGWQERLKQEDGSLEVAQANMQAVNPAVIPRNHRVEEALAAATKSDDLSVMQDLVDILRSPYKRDERTAAYRIPPPAGTRYCTFCGT